jgi:hypothetical protein
MLLVDLVESEEGVRLLGLLLDEHLKILEDDRDGKQNTGSGSNGSEEVGEDSEHTNAHTTKSSRDRDVTVEHLEGRTTTETTDDHLLLLKLLGDITGGSARDFDPGLGEESAGTEDKGDVENSMKRIGDDLDQARGRGHIVSQTANRGRVGSHSGLTLLPATKELDQDVVRVALVQKLGEEVQVGNEGTLKDDGDVVGVEKLDRVAGLLTTVLLVLDREIDTETLEVDDNKEDKYSGQKVGAVGQILAVESLLESTDLVTAGDEKVEEGDDSAFELGTTASVESGGGECLPHDALTDISGNEEGDTRTKPVTLLEELVEDEDNDTSAEELQDNQDGITGTKVVDITVHTRENISYSLTDGDDHTKKLLRTLEEGTVFLHVLVHGDDLGTSEELHDKTRGDDWADTQLHKGSPVRGKDDTHPVEGIRGVVRSDTIQRDLTTHQKDEQSDDGPHHLLLKGNLLLRGGDLREEHHNWLNKVQESHLRVESGL